MSEAVDRPRSTDPQRILEVKGLRTSFYTRAGVIRLNSYRISGPSCAAVTISA